MIEISDKKYWKVLNFNDALLYCSLLIIDGKGDWRMFNNSEEMMRVGNGNHEVYEVYEVYTDVDGTYYEGVWYMSDGGDDNLKGMEDYWVIPVRDIKN